MQKMFESWICPSKWVQNPKNRDRKEIQVNSGARSKLRFRCSRLISFECNYSSCATSSNPLELPTIRHSVADGQMRLVDMDRY
jgi:hypothetical protein